MLLRAYATPLKAFGELRNAFVCNYKKLRMPSSFQIYD